MLFGPGGVGKSLSVLDLALKVATRPLHEIVDPITILGPVPSEAAGAAVVITLEDDTAEIHRRMSALDADGARVGAPFFLVPGLDVPGFDPVLVRQEGRATKLTGFASDALDQLLYRIAEEAGQPICLLVLDPAGDFMDGSEDDAAVVKPLMRLLREVAARHGCTVLLVGHTAKGLLDQDNVGARGMRGSGAWIANARAAFAMWRPDNDNALRVLRSLEMAATPENVARVAYGMMVKANHPGANMALRQYVQAPESGLLHDLSARLRRDRQDENEQAMEILVATVKEAAELELPFQIDGAAGLYRRREELPPPLCKWGDKRLRALGNAALEAGRIEKCRSAGSTAPRVLDVPGGGYSTGLMSSVRTGSLADARRHAARRKER